MTLRRLSSLPKPSAKGDERAAADESRNRAMDDLRGDTGSTDEGALKSKRQDLPTGSTVTLEQAFFGGVIRDTATPPVIQAETKGIPFGAAHAAPDPELGTESQAPVQGSEDQNPDSNSSMESLEAAAHEAVAEAQRAAILAEAAERSAEAAHTETLAAKAEEVQAREDLSSANAAFLSVLEEYDMLQYFDPSLYSPPSDLNSANDPLEDPGRWPSQEAFDEFHQAKADLWSAMYAYHSAETAVQSAVSLEASLVQQAAVAAATAEAAAAAAKLALTAWVGEEEADRILSESLAG
jgi:hypothetical protein